jgi:hypothetical protein
MSHSWIDGWKQVWTAKKIILFAWFLTWCTVIIIGIKIFSLLNNCLGHTMEMTKLLHGFDRTVIEDFMNEHKRWSDSLVCPLIGSALVFLIVSIFNHAGLIACFEKQTYSIKDFLKYGLKYFFPFMGFSILFLVLTIAIGGFFFFVYSKLIGQPIEDYDSEKPFFYSLLITIVLFVLKAAGIWLWSLKTRYYFIKGHSFFKSIFEALKSMYRHVGKSILLILVALLLFAFALVAQKILNECNSGLSWCTMLAVFIGMMMVSLFRYFVRSWIMSMAGNL